MTPTTTTTTARHFAFVQHLDPLRSVEGTQARYACPDLAAVDRHLTSLRRRIAAAGARSPAVVAACREDVDRLLDRRSWLTTMAR